MELSFGLRLFPLPETVIDTGQPVVRCGRLRIELNRLFQVPGCSRVVLFRFQQGTQFNLGLPEVRVQTY